MNQLPQRTFRSYLRVLLSIAKNDLLHSTRYPLNAIFQMLQPIVWLTPIYFMGLSFVDSGSNNSFEVFAGTDDYMSFIVVGAALSSYVNAVLWGMGYALKGEMDLGTLESNWMAPVPRSLFLVGQTLASLATTSFISVGVMVLGWLLFGFHITGNVFLAILVALPMLIALYGFGFAFAGLVLLLKESNALVDVASFTVPLLSGAQFPVQVLPPFLLPLSLVFPLTYGYDAIRGLLLGSKTLLPITYEVLIILFSMVFMGALGYTVFKRVERRCQQLGTIGIH